MAFAGVILLLSGLIRRMLELQKKWIFLIYIVGIVVIPSLFVDYMLLLTLVMTYTLFPIMGIIILISLLVNRKNRGKITETNVAE